MNIIRVALLSSVLGVISIVSGCDWEDTGASSFNTSRGGGINVNFSGYYRPKAGNYVVGTDITHLVLTQTGNSLEVYDSNGSTYSGSIGSPGVVSAPNRTDGTYTAGAALLQGQIYFAGMNVNTRRNVEFVGIIRAIAVSDVIAFVESQAGVSSATSNDNATSVTNTTINIVVPPVSIFQQQTQTEGDGTYDINVAQVNVTHTYAINEGNSWYVLEGNWVEGGYVLPLAAKAPAGNATFVLDDPDFNFDTTIPTSEGLPTSVSSQPNGSTQSSQ